MTAQPLPAAVRTVPASEYLRSVEMASDEAWTSPEYEKAFDGLAGDLVRLVYPHSEADPFGLLVQVLVAFGNVIGRCAFQTAEADVHYGNLYAVLVGETSKSRKGSSWGHVRRLMQYVEPDWASDCVYSGLSTGEGLIHHVRDGREAEPGQKGGADPGVSDKRALIIETEFASVLAAMQRTGNTLSSTLRDAWDRGDLRTMTKGSPERATAAHVSVLAHITRDELRRQLTSTERANGFANRFLWVRVSRSKLLPEGGSLDETELERLTGRVHEARTFAGGVTEMRRDPAARTLWAEIYARLASGARGLVDAVTSRAEAQVLRLSGLYALLDCSADVQERHLRSADALWRYCDDSARKIFRSATGDRLADKILHAVQLVGQPLSMTDVSDQCGRNYPADRLEAAVDLLVDSGRLERRQQATGGRPVTWLCVP